MSWYTPPYSANRPSISDYESRGIIFGTADIDDTTESNQWAFFANSHDARMSWVKDGTKWRLIYGVKNNGRATFYYHELGSQQNGNLTVTGIAYGAQLYTTPHIPPFEGYDSESDALRALNDIHSITYRLTNCTASTAPTEAAAGDTVIVPLTFPSGYGVANASNVYVMNNGVLVPSTYSDGVLTFTMPDPSQSG